MSEIKAGLLKRIYVVFAIVCCISHVVMFAFFLYNDALVLDARTIRNNLIMLFASIASIYFMMKAKNGIVEISGKSKKVTSKIRKKSLLFLFIITLILLLMSYIMLYMELWQIDPYNNNSINLMSLSLVIVATIHIPLTSDD